MEFSGKEVIEHFKKEGHVIKRAPWSFLLSVMIVSVVLCCGCYWLVDHLYASAEKANEVALKAKDATIETISAQRDNYKKQLDDAGLALPLSVKGGGSKVIATDIADRLDVGKNAVVLGKFTGSVAEGAVVLRPDGTNQFGDPNTLAIGLGAEAKGNGSIAIGPGAKAGVTEVYQGLKPTVVKVDLNSMNVATNGAYESELWLTINDPPRGGINVKCGSPAGCLSLNCSAYFIQSVLQAGHGTFNEGHCRVSVVTKEKVGGQSDFLFDIEAVQNPRK